MKLHFSVIIIIPCFNEAKRLDKNKWTDYISTHPNFLFLFVNDGSGDTTANVILLMQEKYDNVRLIHNEKNQGKAGTVRTGMLYAQEKFLFEAIAFIDADHSTPLQEIDRFAVMLKKNPEIDMILGSRVQMLGKKIHRNLFRHYIGRIIATFICKILDEPVYDTQCGLKIMKGNIVPALFKEDFISRWLFDVEILARYKLMFGSVGFKEKLLELPVNEWTEKEDSKLKFYQVFAIVFDLIKINKKYFSRKKP